MRSDMVKSAVVVGKSAFANATSFAPFCACKSSSSRVRSIICSPQLSPLNDGNLSEYGFSIFMFEFVFLSVATPDAAGNGVATPLARGAAFALLSLYVLNAESKNPAHAVT